MIQRPFGAALCTGAALFVASSGFAEPERERPRGGVLERTTGAVGAKTSAPTNGAERSREEGCINGSRCDQAAVVDRRDRRDTRYAGAAGGVAIRRGGSARENPKPPIRLDIAVEAGLHAVRGSDGAGVAAFRIGSGRFAAAIDATHYIESSSATDDPERVYMTRWSLGARARVMSFGPTALWLEAGLSGANSNRFEPLTGVALSAALEHRIRSDVEIRGAARYFAFNENVRARELRGGIGVYFLTLGYRWFAFEETGEPLHGPEFGLAFDF